MAWGGARTLPYLDSYGMDALRDSVIWSYALYALFVSGALLRCRDLAMVPRWFGMWFPWFLVLSRNSRI